MNSVWPLAAAFALGGILGLVYFWGLWATVRHLSLRPWAPLWLLLSLTVRLGILLAGIYWVGAGDWRRFLAALAGVLLARLLATRRVARVPGAGVRAATGGDAP
jgi:F1F0 ATPase subunit 2